MKIVAGNTTIEATPIHEGTIGYNGQMAEAIRLVVNGVITESQINDLASNPWHEYDVEDSLLAVVEGFNTMYLTSVTFLKLPDLVKEVEELRAALAAKEAELQNALSQLPPTTPPEEETP